MNVHDIEYSALQIVQPELERQGYEFLEDYSSSLLPRGLKGYSPDFVAVKDDHYLAIEVKRKRIPPIEKKLRELEAVFTADNKWSFKVYYFDELQGTKGPSVQGMDTIKTTLKESQEQFSRGYKKSAFLLLWAAFEAVSRSAYPASFEKPQSPGRVITVLAEKGSISPKDADSLRELVMLRNALIHGQLDIDLKNKDFKLLSRVIISLQDFIE